MFSLKKVKSFICLAQDINARFLQDILYEIMLQKSYTWLVNKIPYTFLGKNLLQKVKVTLSLVLISVTGFAQEMCKEFHQRAVYWLTQCFRYEITIFSKA